VKEGTTPTATPTREGLERELDATCAALGNDEIRTLVHLARRLLAGQRCYGRLDLENDARNFRRERSEEIQDLLVYSAFIELQKATKAT
jgi:hypothetical protein